MRDAVSSRASTLSLALAMFVAFCANFEAAAAPIPGNNNQVIECSEQGGGMLDEIEGQRIENERIEKLQSNEKTQIEIEKKTITSAQSTDPVKENTGSDKLEDELVTVDAATSASDESLDLDGKNFSRYVSSPKAIMQFYLMAAQIYGFQFGLGILFSGVILLAKKKKQIAYILLAVGTVATAFGVTAINFKELKAFVAHPRFEKTRSSESN